MSKQTILEYQRVNSHQKRPRIVFNTTVPTKENVITKLIKKLDSLSDALVSHHKLDKSTAIRLVFWHLVKTYYIHNNLNIPFNDEGLESKLNMTEENYISLATSDITTLRPDDLDELYEDIVPKDYRKTFGQYMTPAYVANFMAAWGLQNDVRSVLDPAIGTGRFLSAVSNLTKHTQISFMGLDLDPIMLNMANLKMSQDNTSPSVKLLLADFLKYNSNDKFDFIICNPPYNKFHHYDRNNIAHTEIDYPGIKLSKLTNIFALFFLKAFSLVKLNGSIAFITPSEFLYTGYGVKLKELMLKNFEIDAFILTDINNSIFNGATTSSVITLLRKRTPNQNHKVKFIKVFRWPTNTELFDALNGIATDNIHINERLQSGLEPKEKWLVFFENEVFADAERLIPLKYICDVSRGIATGYNEFFTLTESERNEWQIENRFLKPVISRALNATGFKFTYKDLERLEKENEKAYLLYCESTPSSTLKNYIAYGEKLNANGRYLTKTRTPWYSMERRPPAKILATVFSRNNMRFILNETDALNLAAFHCIYPKFNNLTKTKALLAYLNSNVCTKYMRLEKRTYGGGLDKFEPKDLENILVIDINNTPEALVNSLASLFDSLSSSTDAGLSVKIKQSIDAVVKEIIISKD